MRSFVTLATLASAWAGSIELVSGDLRGAGKSLDNIEGVPRRALRV